MENTLSTHQAYLAMYSFLEELYSEYGFDQLGPVLSNMSLLSDGGSADPATYHDFLRAIEKAKAGQVNASLIILKK